MLLNISFRNNGVMSGVISNARYYITAGREFASN